MSPPPPEPCGALDCLLFRSPEQAFAHVLTASAPRVLAIGEAHAQRGTEAVPSATHRFTEQLLPLLGGQASDLLLELVVPKERCGATTERVAEAQAPVVERQAATNKSEFVLLAERSKSLGIRPDVLRPSCAELDGVDRRGPDAIVGMLELIAALSTRRLRELLEGASAGPDALVLAYGGALHNDVTPRAGREGWSFGPALVAATEGRYTELDLIVPEFVKDTDSWRALPWYPHFDADRFAERTVLFRPGPSSFVLVFPRTVGDSPPFPGPTPGAAPARTEPPPP